MGDAAAVLMTSIRQGHLQTDYSGSTPQSWGQLRLGRNIMRRAGYEFDATRVESAGGGGGASCSPGADSISA